MTSTPRDLMLIASTGGHLAELLRLAPLLGASDRSVWFTFRTPQSETLLQGRNVVFLPYVKPRDVRAILRAMLWMAWRMRGRSFDAAVSTGSAIALACFPVAMVKRIPTIYIESLGRVRGPSATGRVLQRLGRTQLYTQSPGWTDTRWSLHPSALSTYQLVERAVGGEAPRVFVTLGTIQGFRFDALVDAVLALGIADHRTVWQLGSTVREDLPGIVHHLMSAEDFRRTVRQADVVISHAGVGSLLVLLEEGTYPLLVTRRAHRGEHVDDHQVEMKEALRDLNIAQVVDVGELDADVIRRARSHGIVDGNAQQGASRQIHVTQIDLTQIDLTPIDLTQNTVVQNTVVQNLGAP